jgi:glucans biosynthesis protein C
LGHAFDKSIGVLTKSDLIIPVLATPVALVFYFSDHWMIWFGIKTPDYSLIPNPMATVAYGTAFAFGWWLHRRHDLLEHIANRFWAYGIVAITGTWWCLNYVGPQLSYAIPAGHEHPIYCLIYPLTAWAWTFALIGLARVTLKTEHPLIRYISESSYWIFIIHMPLLLILQYIVKDWVWPLELKAACIISATLLISILSYKFMVRDTFIGRLLSGRRRDVAEINTK